LPPPPPQAATQPRPPALSRRHGRHIAGNRRLRGQQRAGRQPVGPAAPAAARRKEAGTWAPEPPSRRQRHTLRKAAVKAAKAAAKAAAPKAAAPSKAAKKAAAKKAAAAVLRAMSALSVGGAD